MVLIGILSQLQPSYLHTKVLFFFFDIVDLDDCYLTDLDNFHPLLPKNTLSSILNLFSSPPDFQHVNMCHESLTCTRERYIIKPYNGGRPRKNPKNEQSLPTGENLSKGGLACQLERLRLVLFLPLEYCLPFCFYSTVLFNG